MTHITPETIRMDIWAWIDFVRELLKQVFKDPLKGLN